MHFKQQRAGSAQVLCGKARATAIEVSLLRAHNGKRRRPQAILTLSGYFIWLRISIA